jgi:hypothetical protein
MGNGVQILSKKVIKISYNKYTESAGILNDSITGTVWIERPMQFAVLGYG